MMTINKYVLANIIKLRVKLYNSEQQTPKLSPELVENIKKRYPLPQWGYQIAKMQYQQGLLQDEFKSEYTL